MFVFTDFHSRRATFQQLDAAVFVLLFQHHIKSPQAMHMLQYFFAPDPAVRDYVECNAASANGRRANPRSRSEYSARFLSYIATIAGYGSPITFFIMNSGNLQIIMPIVIQHGEEAEITHHFRRQELADKTLIFEITHREMQRFSQSEPAISGNQYLSSSVGD